MKTFLSLLPVLFLVAYCAPTLAQDEDEESNPAQAEVQEGDELLGSGEEPAHDHEEDSEAHESADHAGHIGNDTTHANLSSETYEVIDFRSDLAFFNAVVFLLLLAGLTATAWKPIMAGLAKREESIAANIAQAEQANANAASKLTEYEAKLASASEEAQAIVAEARKDAEATGQKLIAEAQEEAVRQRERAVADIESAKRVALSEIANQSTQVAMSLAQRVVGREVKAEDHQGLIQEMLAKLPSKN